MASNNTLLCIHREPTQLSLLQENGYDLVTATNCRDGMQLFLSRHVDAIVSEHRLGHRDGSVVAAEIKQVNPQVPIVMLAEDAELPDHAFKSVDALVTKSDGLESVIGGSLPAGDHPLRAEREADPASAGKAKGSNAGTSPASRQVTGDQRPMFSPRSSTGT
jgi:CheY-like chemotaxis protein